MWRLWKTRERRAAIREARVDRLSSEKFDGDVRQLCIAKGRNPNCPYEQLAAAWQLAAEGWEKAAADWKNVI